MYSYAKAKKFSKWKLVACLLCMLILSVSYFSYEYYQSKHVATSVFKEEGVPVLALPSSIATFAKPFQVEAKEALTYFDGKDGDASDVTEFEGVYRGNQGVDYTFNEEAFPVISCFNGTVSAIKDDPVFGKSVTIASKGIVLTYQSLSDLTVKKGDRIATGDPIGKAGKNAYNKELGNHLYLAVEKNGHSINPSTIYGKTPADIK